MATKRRLRFSIQLTLFSIFLIATCLTAGIAILLQYHFSTEQASKSALNQFQMSAKYTRDHLENIDLQATELTGLLASSLKLDSDNELSELLTFAKAMQYNPIYYSIFIGKENGEFTQLINLEANTTVRSRFNAAHTDRWLQVNVFKENNKIIRRLKFLDENYAVRHTTQSEHEFDPRVRPWFVGASKSAVYKSVPYQFQSLQAPGLTYSQKLATSDAVVGVDIALTSLSKYLSDHQLGEHSEIYLYQASGEVIASNNMRQGQKISSQGSVTPITLTAQESKLVANTAPLLVSNSADWSPIDFAISGKPKGYAVDKLAILSQMTGLKFEYINGFTWPELVERYKTKQLDVLQAVYKTPENEQMGSLSEALLELPFALVTQQHHADITHINALNNKSLVITKGWSITEQLKTKFPQIQIIEVNTIREVFDYVRSGRAFAGIDTRLTLMNTQSQFFIEQVKVHPNLSFAPQSFPQTLHLLLQPEHQALLPIINKALTQFSAQHEQTLNKQWLTLQQDVLATDTFAVPNKTLLQAVTNPTLQNQLIQSNNAELVFISPVKINERQQSYFAIITNRDAVFSDSLTEVKVSLFLTAACLVCLLPLSYLFSAPIVMPIRKLMEQNRKIKRRQFDEVTIERSNIKELDQLGASLAEMSASIKQHEKQQAELLESFVELIAQAIDDKSPYTAGHCKRVPDIGIRLAEAASNTTQGIFKDFTLSSTEQKREFKMAAWLHDCGKITTPEYIVDKATKLETIYNRIHEIRMRFEVLYRDAIIEYHQNVQLNPDSQAFYKSELERKYKHLQDDFAFIAACNQGGEFLSDTAITRLENLAVVTWERYFDDTLGLSELELERKPIEKPPLPCIEMLLNDKTEHILPRAYIPDYAEKYGIKMNIPELLSNKGELYNLRVSRGTLTQEDRFRINEHMISTIKMLDSLPFPDDLANVPRWASTHHETLIGTGYPRRLKKEDLSIPERILVVADIFEALTAADRPYKKAKTLSESLKIMQFMVKDQHIDSDVFELFLTSGVYLDYAKQHLDPSQIDEVDIEALLENVKVA